MKMRKLLVLRIKTYVYLQWDEVRADGHGSTDIPPSLFGILKDIETFLCCLV